MRSRQQCWHSHSMPAFEYRGPSFWYYIRYEIQMEMQKEKEKKKGADEIFPSPCLTNTKNQKSIGYIPTLETHRRILKKII